jgi:hypothetical protein
LLDSVGKTQAGNEIKCMYVRKENIDFGNEDDEIIKNINDIECKGKFDKRKYMEIIRETELKRIFETENNEEIKKICRENKIYCSICYEWVYKEESNYCDKCNLFFCKNHELLNCENCKRIIEN